MYTPLYIKTNNSLLTSMIKLDDLIMFAKRNNIKSLTITDNNMYGVMDFYHICINNNIKPIIGLEVLYKECPIILYAKNYDGYLELINITTYDEVSSLFTTFKGYSKNSERNSLTGSNLVYMNETLCISDEDTMYLKYLDGIRESKVLSALSDNHINNYIHLEDEIKKEYPEDIKNNYYITNECNLTIKFHNNLLPHYPVDDSYQYLKELCIKGLKSLFGDKITKNYQDRLKYELSVIKKMGFCDYFLVVWDYVKYAKDNGILVGPGRGSAASSLVAYVLNITTVDPLKYNLLFERFLNPERVTMPDIDVDFEATRRDEVVKYCISKYGEKKVAPIITFGTLGAKQAIRDVSRVMDINLKEVDALSKKINSRLSLKENISNVRDMLEYNTELKDMYIVVLKC